MAIIVNSRNKGSHYVQGVEPTVDKFVGLT